MPAEPPSTIPALLVQGILEPQLGALLWTLVEGGLPVLVTGHVDPAARRAVLQALAGVRPDAPAWEEDLVMAQGAAGPAATDTPTAGAGIRRYLSLARDRRTLGATMAATDLEAVLDALEAPPFGLSRDELGHLGIVLVLAAPTETPEGPPRAVAAHWLRPVTRDAHGHAQRFPPAILGTRDPRTDRWEDFSWGVMPDLAARHGRRAGDLERDVADRAAFLEQLASAGVVDPGAVGAAFAGYALGGRGVGRA